jgi:phospholipase C
LPALSGCGSGSSGSANTASSGSSGNSSGSGSTSPTPATPGTVAAVNHVIFLMQENRTFDTYFGLLNPYRRTNGFNIGDDGKTYDVDGIDDKLTKISNTNDEGTTFGLFKFASACIDDMSSAWLESYGDVNRFDFAPSRPILMDGFVHTAEGFAKNCSTVGCGSGVLTDDLVGRRSMGYYDQDFLNYYYYMASQFAVSDRWFSPLSGNSTPNRIATVTGGTTQGLAKDPFAVDKLTSSLAIPTIFEALDNAHVSWKVYYGITQSGCILPNSGAAKCSGIPDITLNNVTYGFKYVYTPATKGQCTQAGSAATPSGTAVGDPTNAYCIDATHVAPISQYFTDVANHTLPSFAWIDPAYGIFDEHPGSGQSILNGQLQTSRMINALMNSPSWADSVFFLAYDEGGGPYDHVPPVAHHTNDFTDASLGITTDISTIAVNADSFKPCLAPVSTTGVATPTVHCDLTSGDPGASPGDAPAVQGFAAQLGFRLPNMVVSPFTRKHFVSHTPMDHTAIIKFVEDRFIGNSQYLTPREAAQPNLLEFFDFTAVPWATPPPAAQVPTPTQPTAATCTPGSF